MAKDTKKKKFKLKFNPLLFAVLVVVLVPVGIVGYSVLQSLDTKGEPVIGNRFDDQLVNKIEDSALEEFKGTLQIDGANSINVTLKSGTLRITAEIPGIAGGESQEAIDYANMIYEKVDATFPIADYFTNTADGKKSYDLEIHVYNQLVTDESTEEDKAWQVYVVKTKNGASAEPRDDIMTEVKNASETERVLNNQKEVYAKQAVDKLFNSDGSVVSGTTAEQITEAQGLIDAVVDEEKKVEYQSLLDQAKAELGL